MKPCTKCGVSKSLDDFNRDSRKKDGRRPDCKTCQRARVRAYEAGRRDERRTYNAAYYEANGVELRVSAKRTRLSRFGLTEETFQSLLDRQGGKCAVCRATEPGGTGRWHVDHDHNCCPDDRSCGECVRGLLCVRCNTGLGMFRDNPTFLAAAITYLEGAPL